MFGESCTGRVYLNMYEADTILEGLYYLEQFSQKDKKKLQHLPLLEGWKKKGFNIDSDVGIIFEDSDVGAIFEEDKE